MCVGSCLQKASRADLIRAFGKMQAHCKFRAPIQAQLRLACLNFFEGIRKQERNTAALCLKPWIEKEELEVHKWPTLTIGSVVQQSTYRDEQLAASRMIKQMFFSTAVLALFDEEVSEGHGQLYDLCFRLCKLDASVTTDMTEEINQLPEECLQSFALAVEASQIVVAVKNPTPGIFTTSYARISLLLADESTWSVSRMGKNQMTKCCHSAGP